MHNAFYRQNENKVRRLNIYTKELWIIYERIFVEQSPATYLYMYLPIPTKQMTTPIKFYILFENCPHFT